MGARSPIKLDAIFKSELEDYYNSLTKQDKATSFIRYIDETSSESEIEGYVDSLNAFEFSEMLKELCEDRCTGDLKTDLIMGAYYANINAHRGDYQYYALKSKLLQYSFPMWGEKPYDSYGLGYDSYGNPVAYFDVPECGQVSFHLKNNEEEDYDLPRYKLGWCEFCNYDFPTFRKIEHMHNLQFALGDTSDEAWDGVNTLIKPLNFYAIPQSEKTTIYLMQPIDYFNYEYMDNDIDSISSMYPIQRVTFSKDEGIIDSQWIKDKKERVEIMKKNAPYNRSIREMMEYFNIPLEDEPEML